MPMTYEIDTRRRLVIARGTGDLTMADIFAYHEEVWSRSDVIGFGEIVDFSQIADTIEAPSNDIIKLSKIAAAKDANTGSRKLAIVAKGDLFFGLGRMYQAYRETAEDSQKKVGVFRTMEEAQAWISD